MHDPDAEGARSREAGDASAPENGRGPELRRRLGTADAVGVGVGAMLGAGVFTAFAPAARAAGAGLLVGLMLAAVIAYCNATSSARLAAIYPTSGGAYVYGRERLGRFWGYLAGWSFVTGKVASCAAMALTVGHYLAPRHVEVVAVAVLAAILAVNYFGLRSSARLTRYVVVIVLAVLAAVACAGLAAGSGDFARVRLHGLNFRGVLQAAGFLFFAFAGYARIATLGEEVIDPRRTIPRAIRISFAVILIVYAVLAFALLVVLDARGVAATPAPISALAGASSVTWLEPAVRAAAALAAVGALLALLLGVSRTTFAMARDRYLPRVLAAVSPRSGVPYRAEVAVGLIVIAVVLIVDVRGAIGFSSFLVLVYYAIANAAALTIAAPRGARDRALPLLGLLGCSVVALSLPFPTITVGLLVVAIGSAVYLLTRAASAGRSRED